MIRQANNVFMSVQSNYDVLTSTLPAVGTVITNSNIPAGAVVLTDLGLRRMDNTAYVALQNGQQFLIVQGNGIGRPLLKSPVLTKGRVLFSSKKFLPATQQITTIGYNGTTGELPTANDTTFYIKVRKNDNDSANQSQPMSLFAGPVKTDATGTQEELAFMLLKSGTQNFTQEPDGYLTFELVNSSPTGNDALSALGTPTGDLTVTKKSKVVTMTATTSLTAGDYLRFEGDTSESTLGAIYKIATVNSATQITLTTAWVGASGVVDDATVFYIPIADIGDDWGVKLSGVADPFDVNKWRNYYTNRFTATFSDDGVTLVTHIQGATNGNGVWQQVAMDEYMTWGYEGQNEMLGVPPTMRDQYVKIPGVGSNTVLSSRYSVANIAWTEEIAPGITTMSAAKGNVLIYVNLSTAGSLTATVNTGLSLLVALGVLTSNSDTSLNA